MLILVIVLYNNKHVLQVLIVILCDASSAEVFWNNEEKFHINYIKNLDIYFNVHDALLE